jgi:hypothetical protein
VHLSETTAFKKISLLQKHRVGLVWNSKVQGMEHNIDTLDKNWHFNPHNILVNTSSGDLIYSNVQEFPGFPTELSFQLEIIALIKLELFPISQLHQLHP